MHAPWRNATRFRTLKTRLSKAFENLCKGWLFVKRTVACVPSPRLFSTRSAMPWEDELDVMDRVLTLLTRFGFVGRFEPSSIT